MSESATADHGPGWPRWLEEAHLGLSIAPQFLIHGNVRDQQMVPSGGALTSMRTTDALWQLLSQRGFRFALVFDRNGGLSVTPADAQGLAQSTLGKLLPWMSRLGSATPPPEQFQPSSISKIMDALNQTETRCALIVENASRMLGTFTDPREEMIELAAWRRLSYMAAAFDRGGPDSLYNPTFWLADTVRDFPTWLVVGNDRIRTILAASPDFATRRAHIESMIDLIDRTLDKTSKRGSDLIQQFTLRSEGLTLRAIEAVIDIARDRSIPLERIEDAIRCYKVGLPKDPWREPHLRDRMRDGETIAKESVLGQKAAVSTALDILKRAVLGLSGAQSASSLNRPRGVLFFAGPTGVGKTELAKCISEILFGDKDSFVRFDMSEFSAEHSDARLIGAPPGFIGHDAGGELVNAIRERPFSVLLFDEIEKAHPRILDKFLQILEDGRLTDGRGDTVYFSDAVIIFTSNLGVIGQNERGEWVPRVRYGASYDQLKSSILDGVREHFHLRLQRPELLNRIGENIVVFDFIRPDVAEHIFERNMESIKRRLHFAQKLSLTIDPRVRASLLKICTADLTNGGRGIGSKLEACLINPLARVLFELATPPGATVKIEELIQENGDSFAVRATCSSG